MAKVLVTGGAGFIGSHIVDELLKEGHEVTVFDNLEPLVHGDISEPPDYCNPEARFVFGDVRDFDGFSKVLKGQDIVFHQAAMVGVGQSMYQVSRYVGVNSLGTANLLESVVNQYRDDVQKIIVASSMSIYGEGLYQDKDGNQMTPQLRSDDQMSQKQWEHLCSDTGEELIPLLTPETKPLHSTSIYAISKKDQEEMVLNIGRSYQIPVVALRYFNVFGPRQSLSNPYTGVCAIFSSCLKNNNAPHVFEDGLQSRDFVSVYDITKANLLAMKTDKANYQAINVGTGHATTILEVAQVLAELYGKKVDPVIDNRFREGDVRHCIADVALAREQLGFEPSVSFKEGMEGLVNWGQTVEAEDRTSQAVNELLEKGLVK